MLHCRRGDELEVHGLKWWTTGACLPSCAVAIFMGKTDPSAAPHRQQSMVLVPMDTPGGQRQSVDLFAFALIDVDVMFGVPNCIMQQVLCPIVLSMSLSGKYHHLPALLPVQVSQWCGLWRCLAMTQRRTATPRCETLQCT